MSTRFIDKYEIVSTLGRGSMGVVYKGRDPEIGRLVAIKTLKSVFMGDDPAGAEALQRFRLESRSAGKLHHPNIVTIFEAGRTESGSPYIVMEYIEGKSLESIVADQGPLEPLSVLHYLAQIASAIDYAHSQNVIHRDIKPSNILIDEKQRPHLLDFGVAKLSDTSLTPAGTVVGTPSYMSPEQIRGATLDGRTDIFSLGVVAFEIFTGVRPFPGSDFTTVVSNIIHKEPLSFKEVGTDLISGLESVLGDCLAKERENRFSSALEFVDAMAQAFGVIIDGTGLVGGYSSETTLEEAVKRAQRIRSEGSAAAPSSFVAAHPGGGSAEVGETATVLGGSAPAVEESGESKRVNGVDHDTDAAGVSANIGGTAGTEAATTVVDPAVTDTTRVSAGSGSKGIAIFAGIAAVLVLGAAALWGGYRFLASTGTGPRVVDGDPAADGTREVVEVPIPDSTAEPQADAAEEVTVEVIPDAEPVVEATVEELQPGPPEVPPGGFTTQAVKKLSEQELLGLMQWPQAEPKWLIRAATESAERKNPLLVPGLTALLKHPQLTVRVTAIKALASEAYLNENNVVAALIEKLDDEDPIARGFAAKVVGSIPKPEVKAALEKRLSVEEQDYVKDILKKSLQGAK